MKPNGYQYRYKNPTPCEKCGKKKRSGGFLSYYMLYEANGDKLCRECAKAMLII